jgi:hypothetical protein
MTARERPLMCPIMRELIAVIARGSPVPGPREWVRLIDRLTELEAEALATNAPQRTVEAIRAKRLQVRVDSLMPRSSGLRGH